MTDPFTCLKLPGNSALLWSSPVTIDNLTSSTNIKVLTVLAVCLELQPC